MSHVKETQAVDTRRHRSQDTYLHAQLAHHGHRTRLSRVVIRHVDALLGSGVVTVAIGPSHPIRMVVGADDAGVAQAFPNTELAGRDSAHPARRKVLTTCIGAGVHFFRTRCRMHILGAGSHLRLKDNDITLSARFGISCARR